MVKFAWLSDKMQREGELLRLAKEGEISDIAVWLIMSRLLLTVTRMLFQISDKT